MRELTEEEKAMAATVNEAKEKPEEWADVFDFTQIFRVKGVKNDIFWPRTMLKNRKLLMVSFQNSSKKQVFPKDLIPLSELRFYEQDGTERKIDFLFNNLHEFEGLADIQIPSVELQEAMLPNYDPTRFKPYHAEWVVRWYTLCKLMTEEPEITKQ